MSQLAIRARSLAFLFGFGLASPTVNAHPSPTAPKLTLRHVHRKETLSVRLLDAKHQIRREALAKLRDFLACHKTGANHPIHWRLASILLSISAHWPDKPILIHSGYRDPSVSEHAKRSNHTRGRAVDIRVPGVPNRRLFALLVRSFQQVGLGYYPNSAFVHLDIREHSAIWVDYAGPGQSACYSQTPTQDLQSGLADRLTIERARARGCKSP